MAPDKQPPRSIVRLTPEWFSWWEHSNLKTWSTAVTAKGLGLTVFDIEGLKKDALASVQTNGRILAKDCVGREKAKILDRLQSQLWDDWKKAVKSEAPEWFVKKCMRLVLLSAKAGHTRAQVKRKSTPVSDEESDAKRTRHTETASPPPVSNADSVLIADPVLNADRARERKKFFRFCIPPKVSPSNPIGPDVHEIRQRLKSILDASNINTCLADGEMIISNEIMSPPPPTNPALPRPFCQSNAFWSLGDPERGRDKEFQTLSRPVPLVKRASSLPPICRDSGG